MSKSKRYFLCKDTNDALGAANAVGGAILYVDGYWRCYSQKNRLFLDFPGLRAASALPKEMIRHLMSAGVPDTQIVTFMASWREPVAGTPQALGMNGVRALIKEIEDET